MWESKAYLLVLIWACYIFTASSFPGNRIPSRCRKISSLNSAELRKNVGLYSEFGTEVGKQARIESIVSSTLKSGKLYKPEVLAPAGGWPQLKAAISNGADAVYFGLQQGFNARARASNFNIDELEEVMNYLHDRGAKGYLVVNILVFDSEIERLKELVPRIASAGVDALIMQDIGAAALVHSIAPNLPIHGSTQMSITDAKGIDFTQRLNLGIDRIVVGRELSIAEISSISQSSPVEIEAFVHGALCVSYSGQCFSSEAWGGRSANRGQCAQACRMPYGLIVNGSLTSMIDDARYLLSPQDLMAVDLVPDLIKAGVRSFKIEGRLKGPEYVAITTKVYRDAIDEAWNDLMKQEVGDNKASKFNGPNERLRRDLRQVFSRGQDETYDGLSQGFLAGVKHQSLVRGRSPRHRGNFIGRVQSISKKGVVVKVEPGAGMKRGDGVVFDRNLPEEKEEGGAVYEIFDAYGKSVGIGVDNEVQDGIYTITFATNAIDFSRIKKGDIVWRSKDPSLESRLKSYVNEADLQTVPVSVSVSGKIGECLRISIVDREGKEGIGHSDSVLQAASNRPLTASDLEKAVGSLGDTPFRIISDLSWTTMDTTALEDGLFLPSAEVKAARRKAVDHLIRTRREHSRAVGLKTDLESCSPDFDDLDSEWDEILMKGPDSSSVDSQADFYILCRNLNQVRAACKVPWLKEVALDFLEVHGLREAVAEVKNAKKIAIVATPRILKPDEQRLWTFYLRLKADALLVRSSGFLQQMLALGGSGAFVEGTNSTIPLLYGDFSLNAANIPSAKIYLSAGLSRLTPTHDLNAEQIADLVNGIGLKSSGMIDCIIHQHLPIFHTEHCVFCRFLSDGNNYKDCGHPCETNNVDLRDLNGKDHTVLADMGCRNTIFNAEAQSGAVYIKTLMKAGVKKFRIELVDEDESFVESMLNKYRDLTLCKNDKQYEQKLESLLQWLRKLPNRNGLSQGVGVGSLKPAEETEWETMKPTAYQIKAVNKS